MNKDGNIFICIFLIHASIINFKFYFSKAVQNERQPRNTATIRPEVLLSDSNSERLLREGVAATVAAVFGLSNCGSFQY